jgi:HlyD family secretion protein
MGKTILKIVVGVILVPLISFFGYKGYQQYLAPPPPTPTPTIALVEKDPEPQIVSVEGKLVPLEYARLSFKNPGLVKAVNVKEGDQVRAGEVMASLEGREQLEATLASAKMELIAAQQALDELIELAPLQTAQAQQNLAYAKDALEDVQRRWQNNQEGNRANTEDIEDTEERLADADAIVKRAEDEYAQFADRAEDDPLRMVAYSGLVAARQLQSRLQGQLNWYKGSPSYTDQAILDAELAVAEGQLAEAERQWANLKDGPDKDKIELAQAQVESANAQVAAVQSSLEDLELRATFNGTVITLDLKAGESVNPAVPVIVLADISRWQVETIDLTENDFALIFPGMDALISLNAYPDRVFHGTVREISLLGQDSRGSVTYTVILDFDPEDAKVQWGMTTFIDIPLE